MAFSLNCLAAAAASYTACGVSSSRILESAVPLLVWQRTTRVEPSSMPSRAHFTILWETVLVNRTSRSGHPIFLSMLVLIWVKTFALHLNSLHIFLYWLTIRSWPPIITTLIYDTSSSLLRCLPFTACRVLHHYCFLRLFSLYS